MAKRLIPFIIVLLFGSLGPYCLADDVEDGITAYQKQDYQAAMNAWSRAAKQGDPNAHYNLGQLYRLGQGVEINYFTAKSHYLPAAQKGHLLAQINLGTLFYFDKLGPDQYENAFYWLYKAAQQNDPHAQWMTGVMLFNGQGVTQNSVSAYSWLTLASQQNHPRASQDQSQLKAGLNTEQLVLADKLTADFKQRLIDKIKAPTQQKEVIHSKQYRVQVGSYQSSKTAAKALSELTQKLPNLVAKHIPIITQVNDSDQHVFYRLQLGDFSMKKEATKLCKLLADKKQACFVVSATAQRQLN